MSWQTDFAIKVDYLEMEENVANSDGSVEDEFEVYMHELMERGD